MYFLSKMEPFWEPMGTHKSQKPAKVPPKIALFTPSEKRLKNHRFLDPPEPSELSWRLHKTSIFTCWPCPQNGIETTSQTLHFGYLWTPKSPTVTKRSVPENALKNTCNKYGKNIKMTSKNVDAFGPETLFFAVWFQTWSPECPRPLKYSIFHQKCSILV